MKNVTKKPAAMVGCGIGDAAGAAFEFKSANDPRLLKWKGAFVGGGWGLKAGQWTDDTHMALRLADVLLEGFSPRAVIEAYAAWKKTGDLRGIGSTCSASISHYVSSKDIATCGATGKYAAGNGTAMRVAPIGLFAQTLPELIELAVQDADVTHRNVEAEAGSIAVAYGVRLLSRLTTPTAQAVRRVVQQVANVMGLMGPEYRKSDVRKAIQKALRLAKTGPHSLKHLLDLGTSGYVVHTVGAAFYCLLSTGSFREAVVAGVKGGSDADTTGAVVGALAGALYGLDQIPAEYLKGVEARERLVSLDERLYRRGAATA